MSPMAPSLLVSSVEPSLTTVKFKFGFGGAVMVRPFLEMAGELGVGDDVNAVNAADGREVVEHVLDHRLARDGQERFGLGEGERIQARGVSGGEDDDFHFS